MNATRTMTSRILIQGAFLNLPTRTLALPRLPVPVLAALAMATAAMFWGTSFVAAKAVLTELPPVTVAFLRFAIGAAVLVPLACRGGRRPALGVQPALLGLTGVTLFFLFQNAGLHHTSATHATLILGGGLPLLTSLLAACCLREHPTRRQLTGLACSLLGVISVTAAGIGAGGSSLLGDGLLVLAAASGAAYVVLGRRAFAGPNSLAVLAGGTLWGTLLLAPPVAAEAMVVGLVWPSPGGLLLLLHLGLGCSALAFALGAYGLRHLTAAQNAIVGALELPIGLAAAALLLGEVLGSAQLAGGALLLAGAAFAVGRETSGVTTPERDHRGAAEDRDTGHAVRRIFGLAPRRTTSPAVTPNPRRLVPLPRQPLVAAGGTL